MLLQLICELLGSAPLLVLFADISAPSSAMGGCVRLLSQPPQLWGLHHRPHPCLPCLACHLACRLASRQHRHPRPGRPWL